MRVSRRPRLCRKGISLLEVILAVAIFAAAVAVLGELTRIGSRHAQIARDLTQAQIHCETKVAEVVAGLLAAEGVSSSAIEDAPGWLFSVTAAPLGESGDCMAVTVTVTQDSSVARRPVSFSLTRWVDLAALSATSSSDSSSSQSDSGSSSSSSSASGNSSNSSSNSSSSNNSGGSS